MKYQNTNPLAKLKPGEPYFFLRAQDIHAPAAVRTYASILSANGDHAGSRECFAIVDAMIDWQKQNPDSTKKPD